jgi:PKD repeat protein
VGAPRPAAALDVIGNINVNTTWHKSDSPVRLTGDVTVQGHVTLTIEAGTVIEAAASDGLGSGTDTSKVEFIIKGSLIAEGSPLDHIIIHGATSGPTGWYGISFEPGAHDSRLSFTDISDAVLGIYARTTSALGLTDFSIANCGTGLRWQASPGPTLTRGTIRNSATAGVLINDDGTSGAQATFSQCNITHTAGTGLKLTTRVQGVVDRSQMSANDIAIDTDAGSALTLTNSLVFGNRQVGVSLNQSASNVFRVINNTIDRNNATFGIPTSAGVGILVSAVSDASKFIIRNNNVTTHGTVGIQVMGMTSPSLDHNNVWGNAMNYSTGTSGGTGAISANPLYRLTLGSAVTGASFSHLGYPNNDNWSFKCSDPAALSQAVQFTSFDTETNDDVLQLLDAAGSLVQQFSGALGAFTTMVVAGNNLSIHFTSDSSVTRNGFAGNCVSFYDTNNYRLQSGSPAIDVGNNLDAPGGDYDAVTRPVDGDMDGTATADIGAFEWHMNRSPVAKPGSDLLVLVNTAVSFDGRASYDPDGSVVSYAWDFGDASPMASTPQAMHTYTMLGTYTVKLTVTDDQGATASDTLKVTVVNNLPPVAKPGPDQKINPGDMASFDGSASYDPDGTVVSYDWNFGDGTPHGSGRTVTHSYAAAGTYMVTLTVTDNKGATGTGTLTVTVGAGGMVDMATPADMAMMSMDAGMMGSDGGGGTPDLAMSTDAAMPGTDAGSGVKDGGGSGGGQDGGGSGSPDLGQSGGGGGNPPYHNEAVGCGCRVAGSDGSTPDAGLAIFCGLLLILARRRFGRRHPPRIAA